MPTPGDKVKIITSSETIEGILVPSPKEDTIIIKMSNGYNLGVFKKEVKEIVVLEKSKPKETKSESIQQIRTNNNLPKILILHTGGTIASKVDYRTGGVTSSFSPKDLINLFPELSPIARRKSELISQMWPDDRRFPILNKFGKFIVFFSGR